ncbi:MAG TPA: GNAT family N-acetyltransferase [Nannocystis sp.]|jgi:GNAT superfamily N-acetyltransferase
MMIAGYNHDELLQEVLVRPREAHVPYADLREVVRPGWHQIVTPSFFGGGLNGVDLAVLDHLDHATADAVIDATIAEYDALGIRFRWEIGPDSRPRDLAARLEARGLTSKRVLLLAAAIADLDIEAPPDVVVEPVGEHNLASFVSVVAAGWGMVPDPLIAYERAVVAHRSTNSTTLHQSFLATIDGEPAGAANAVCFPRSLYLMGAVVLPAHRGRGVYRSLIAARLHLARARGVGLATSQALADTSAPILARMGFVTVAEQLSFAR